MSRRDNAALRLYAILVEAVKQDGNPPVAEAWRRVFGEKDGKDVVAIFGRLQELSILVTETEVLVRRIKGIDLPLYLGPLVSIRAALNASNLDVPWREVLNKLTPDVIKGLAFCANRIGESFIEDAIEEEELKSLAKDLSELFEIVKAAEISEALREILLQLIEAMRRAIVEYRIRGTDGVNAAVAQAIGTLVINRENVKTEKDRSVFAEFLGFLDKIGAVITKVRPYFPALKVAAKYYLPEASAEIDEILPR